MQFRNLGSSGLKVSVVGLGSWLTIGNSVDAKATARLVALAFERGVNLFDTADVYNRGEAERVLGASIKSLPRHRLVLATKCFFPMSDDPNDCGLSRKHVHESLAASLRRLQTDYVDLYQCHRFDPATPLLETARAMHDLIVRGLVLYWGTSQWPAEKIAEVVELCRAERLHGPISNQPLYNLFERGIETEVLPVSVRCGLGTLVFSPLAQGVLTGKYRPGENVPADSRAADGKSNQFIARYLAAERLAQAQQLVPLAAREGLSATQLALAFCLRDADVTSVLVGARNPAQLEGSLAAVGVTVGSDLMRDLDRIFPEVSAVSEVVCVNAPVLLRLPDAAALRQMFELRYGPKDRRGWGPLLRAAYGHYTPDDVYEALVAGIVVPGVAWLDVGCGRQMFPSNRELASALSARCARLVGVDPDPTLQENESVHEKAACRIDQYDGKQQFDVVTLRMVAEHVADPEAAVRSIERALRKGGIAVVFTVFAGSPVPLLTQLAPMRLRHVVKRWLWGTEAKDTFPTRFRMNTRGRLQRLFAGAGMHEEAFLRPDDCRTFARFRSLCELELRVARLCRWVGLPYPEHCLLGVYRKP